MNDDMRDILQEAARRIFEDQPSDLWVVLQSSGFDKALLPESKGGVGVGSAYGLPGIAGEHAAALRVTRRKSW